ncbi:MAG: 23S rRNA (adenine(2503)-C(2))-methyltransferase RlmN [Armatimonadetes bacterium]|nr:23S rRNA (adenine(2503)-C(2))-methyltransferase RlmN [Armatimonadota bacterium]
MTKRARRSKLPGQSRASRESRGQRELRGQRQSRVSFEPRVPLTPQTLISLYRPDLAEILAEDDLPSFRHSQICEQLFSRPLRPFSEATALPGNLRDVLDALGVSVLTQKGEQRAPDGTTKFLLAGSDGVGFEAVFMPYKSRATACISSQIGCPVGCAFCATGAMGLKRNLSAAEIVDQVRAIQVRATAEGLRLTNLVYMGMGEPLLNLRAVLDSVRIISDPHGLGMAHRSISISTVGIPAGIRALAHSEPQVNLALSLHAADDSVRATLIPGAFRHTIAEVLDAAWEHFDLTGRKLLVEYVLLGEINDSPHDARRLAALLRGHVVAVNLIPWNPIPGLGRQGGPPRPSKKPTLQSLSGAASSSLAPTLFRAPSSLAVAAFRQALLDAHIETVVRRSKGGGIGAACGQLARGQN